MTQSGHGCRALQHLFISILKCPATQFRGRLSQFLRGVSDVLLWRDEAGQLGSLSCLSLWTQRRHARSAQAPVGTLRFCVTRFDCDACHGSVRVSVQFEKEQG
jgi:hypothetical protein